MLLDSIFVYPVKEYYPLINLEECTYVIENKKNTKYD